jgi:hypothetical protein
MCYNVITVKEELQMTGAEYINSIVVEGDKQYQLQEYYYKKLMGTKNDLDELTEVFNKYHYHKSKVNEYITILEHLDKLYELMKGEKS